MTSQTGVALSRKSHNLQAGIDRSICVFIILPLVLFGALMGFYTAILMDFSASKRRPPFFSWEKGRLDWRWHPCSGWWAFSLSVKPL